MTFHSAASVEFDCRFRYPSGFLLDAAFAAGPGVTVLLGPSGSGKTTILSLIAGLLEPDTGRIAIRGRTIVDPSANVFEPPERRGTGLLFQDHRLFPHLRARTNIAYGMRRQPGQGVPVERVVDELQLEGLLDRFPRNLSGGQQQRVALARAIVSARQVLLLDEPFTAVEVELRERMAAFVREIPQAFNIPVLLVSHDHLLARTLAETVVQIEDGRIRKDA